MICVLFLLAFDSLPPLPDLSRISFPEPLLWIITPEDTIGLLAYTGQCTHLKGGFRYSSISASGLYTDHLNWGVSHYGTGKTTISFGFPRVFLEPSCTGLYMKYGGEKRLCLTPGLTFSSTNPWSIIQGSINYSFWRIHTTQAVEANTMIDIIFDQIEYKPQLRLPGVYINSRYTQFCGFAFHIRNFHISSISPVSNYFPAPCFRLEYLIPAFRIGAEIRSGVVLKTLKDRFDPLVPIHYRMTNPVESLRVEVRIGAQVRLHNHSLEINGQYSDWNNYLIPSQNFILKETLDVKNMKMTWAIRNQLHRGRLTIAHTVCGTYIWGDTNIPLQPPYTIVDTLIFEYSVLYAQANAEYRAAHTGITGELPTLFLLHPSIGIRFTTVTIFGTVFNSTGVHGEYYDGYSVPARAFAGGIRFKTTF